MNIARTFAMTALVVASLPLLAQQAGSSSTQPGAPAATPAQAQQPAAPPDTAAPSQPPTAATAAAEMSPVNGELVDKLDSKTAKTGDAVVIKTDSKVKTADGTEIPKGSKLMGHVTGVKPSGQGNENSQVALQFDHAELKGGQSLPIHAEIVGLAASDSEMASSAPSTMAATPSAPPSGGAVAPGGSMNGTSSATATANPSMAQPQMNGGAATASPSGPTPGTVVARTGNIAIRTTSIPGVLLANNAPGQQDPRMAQSSGILLGPKQDIHLDGGTRVIVGVSAAGASAPGGN